MTARVTIACVCVPGPGGYTMEHVKRLYDMVVLQMPERDFDFFTLTETSKPGYWSKIDLFRPSQFTGRVLYLDLDVDVVGPLDDLIHYPAPFVAINDWHLPGINSSVMAWDAGACDHVYSRFTPSVIERCPGGDQQWIHEQIKCATFPPEWCVSYKKHVRPTGQVPAGARVVVYHGDPKPWEIDNAEK